MDIKKIEKIIGSENVLLDEPMKKHSNFRSGGNAKFYLTPQTVDEFVEVVKYLKENDEKFIVLGRGTNILVKDGGLKETVVSTFKMTGYEINGEVITANAGTPLALIANKALASYLAGFEFAGGIPGSLGGGVFMNAGAHGGEMKDVLIDVTVFDTSDGKVKVLKPEDLDLRYRHSNIEEKGYIVLSARIQLHKGNKEEIKASMDEFKEYRTRTQPSDPSAGSTFKRPEGYIAAKLIDEAGLKGYHIGDAGVSEKHAGFVINKSNASTKEILDVIDYVKKEVYNKYKVKLEEEVRIIGEDN
ncbi:UDP-N-acetylmuramate dehydrogenase [Anaerofustis stercorihominis DSM 17244]|uniref:UDP-N-acetylenolpyruvoylglucosamine reductase n=1 Tax=Anaerofustis stercorihominis DSM 17244 TaxID=445971 RepID=B1C8I4_9FIRM|nr:UDP-N-acetylmuramate dehydrogenase [Anaerofustis stercorihominis]EDS71894.1 UDP-N-acetylmuramate dehydrogenase [Anaerofustis stercorihominis DSM 17244]